MTNKIPYIHPFLFAVFPVLYRYSFNIEKISFSDTYTSFIIFFLFTAILLLISKFIFRNSQKGGIIVSLFLLLFFSYGYVMDVIYVKWLHCKILPSPSHKYLLSIWFLFFIFGLYFVLKSKSVLINLNKILLFVALILNGFSLFSIGIFESKRKDKYIINEITETNSITPDLQRGIYYIILDGYASSETLKNIYNFDNSSFLKQLENKGFYIANKSFSNYPETFLSLASSLNLNYINDVGKITGYESTDGIIPYKMVRNNQTIKFLKSKGYKYIHYSSRHEATDYNPHATINFSVNFMNTYFIYLTEKTILRAFIDLFEFDLKKSILFTIDGLGKAHKIKGPKFIFAHIVSPHFPYLFGKNGETVSREKTSRDGNCWKQKENYINQLQFVNKKILNLVDEIISNSETLPVIIIQADHGPGSKFEKLSLCQTDSVTNTMLKERMGIINAYFLPEICDANLYDSISPINTFRVIFNSYFNTHLELLEDRCFFSTYEAPYKFVDVTEALKK